MTTRRTILAKVRRARRVGLRGLAQRIAQRAYLRTGAAELSFNLAFDDILDDVPAVLPVPSERPETGRPLSIGWVCTPPAPGSGGHTTLFRMVEGLEARGHRCTVFLYDRHGVDVEVSTAVIRQHWPRMRADVRDIAGGAADTDAVVASGWETVHVIARRVTHPVRRLYFIQDYEPYFYGHGAERELAAMTYLLPFRRLVLGEMLDQIVTEKAGVSSDVVPFGCDGAAYGLPPRRAPRTGIVFFSRPDFARRGYQIAVVALRLFAKAHPDQPIHVYGAFPRGLDVPHVFHGRLTAAELNELYGQTIAGLAMSFTNITLVAEEMLAAGNIPVVNDMAEARLVLTNPHVRWAAPTARALAAELSAAVSAADGGARAEAAASSVVGRSWKPTQDAVARVIEEEVYGGAQP